MTDQDKLHPPVCPVWGNHGKHPAGQKPRFLAAVGYETSGPLRGEIEFGYRSSSWDKFADGRVTYQGNLLASGDVEIPGDPKTMSLMANGIFSFGEARRFKPYVGAGVGFARHEASPDAVTLTDEPP